MDSQLVRFSRDGDQYHYLWAARRCLRLLSASSGLIVVTIESASPVETAPTSPIEAGETLIDVAEYYGSEDIAKTNLVRYIQLKHSTQNPTNPWLPSGLEKTLKGFADRYKALAARLDPISLTGRVEFVFVSNRPIQQEILETVEDAVKRTPARHPTVLTKFENYTSLAGRALADFCATLHLQGKQEGLWNQRDILTQEVSGYLPDADVEAPLALKELVTRKALSENALNPRISKIDVLRALNTDESHLQPAPCLIQPPENGIPRELEQRVVREIIDSRERPIVVHATAGVGKSVFATRIRSGLPLGSLCVVYDCFGNGQYRSASRYRHRHKDGLVQIANELAQQALCYPLIPTAHADSTSYLRAFWNRIAQSVHSLRTLQPDALLCIAIDAADNAQIAAEELGEVRSFARDLLRESIPEGVRLIVTCRTHRISSLDPPSNARRLELESFSHDETARYLRLSYPQATDMDVEEFHRLSSHNPRVQATAISRKLPLNEILKGLGPDPTTVDDTLARLLSDALTKLRDRSGVSERTQIDGICAGLAVLRPLVPTAVLAALAEVTESAIKSFVLDLGRPLVLLGDTIQFFDEPAETWFREQFKPPGTEFTRFIERLKPLAAQSAYVASVLPQLMLEAGHISELIRLALSSEGLPHGSPLGRRDVELQRLQFALKAVLRVQRYADAAKLALKAGGEAAGNGRLQRLIQQNTDLAATLMDANRVLEIVSRRSFEGGWLGTRYAYEAGFLSVRSELHGDARSRLRMAYEWLKNWSHLPERQRDRERVEIADIAEIAMASLNIHDPQTCAEYLRSWRPREISYSAGRILARRLMDHSRYDDLNHLAMAAGNDLGLVLAITVEARKVNRLPPKEAVIRTIRLLQNHRVKIRTDPWGIHQNALLAVTALVESAQLLQVDNQANLAALLTRYLPKIPPRAFSSSIGATRFTLLRAYALQGALIGQSPTLADLAYPELRTQLLKNDNPNSGRERREFQESIGVLLPWHQLWANAFVGLSPQTSLACETDNTASASARSADYDEGRYGLNEEIARLRWQIVTGPGQCDRSLLEHLAGWIASLKRPLSTSTLTYMTRCAARHPSLRELAFNLAHKAFSNVKDQRIDAEEKAKTYLALARAIMAVSISEAGAYFSQAVEIAGKIGDENLTRWQAILDLADRAGGGKFSSEIAYKFSRCGEITYEYAGGSDFNWTATVRALASLCPPSSLAILSRWRDRHFGQYAYLLPIAIETLVGRAHLNPRTALSLLGFRAAWDYNGLLGRTLNDTESKAQKQVASDFAFRYMQLTDQPASAWRATRNLLRVHGIGAPGLDELVAFTERAERSASNLRDTGPPQERAESIAMPRDWNLIFNGLDVHTATGLSTAYDRFRSGNPPFYTETFFKEAFARTDIGQVATFIHAFSQVPQFDLYELRGFLKVVPQAWGTQLSARSALADLLKALARRYCMSISRNQYYEPLPLKWACEVCGVEESELLDIVLAAIGESSGLVDASRLFTLVGLLTSRISPAEALDALHFGLTLFDTVASDTDGDGPWVSSLDPPADVSASLAGYIWAALGAPEARIRWEAAHAVRGLCRLDQAAVVSRLIEAATRGDGGPFADARLHFYAKHARQWLIIAFARAVNESPGVLAAHSDFFVQLALKHEPHVIVRGFAAKIALALVDAGLVTLDAPTRQQLVTVNISKCPRQESKPFERIKATRSDGRQDRDSTRFHFDMDMGSYWFAPLGSCFALSSADIADRADQVIVDEWCHTDITGWEKDERLRRRIFDSRDVAYRYTSYPRTDDLRFYLSYHALMVTAGRLLDSIPLHQDVGDPECEFDSWLRRHTLARKDGRWLADRRDADPLERPQWKDSEHREDWRWSLSKVDFARLAGIGTSTLVVWGDWKTTSASRIESVEVRSALATAEKSEALLRALQTSTDPHDYHIPDSGDQGEIGDSEFRLQGWIAEPDRAHGIDEFDQWVGNTVYPPIAPAAWASERLGLSVDDECRVWSRIDGDQREEFLWSQSWGRASERGDEDELEYGRRLRASISVVEQLLQDTAMNMIVEVRIKRTTSQSTYERNTDHGIQYPLPPYTRYFLINRDGDFSCL